MSEQVQLDFKRGNSSNLPTIGVDGAFYLTKDTHKLFHSLGGSLNPINVCKAHYFSNEEALQRSSVFGDKTYCISRYQIGDSIYIDGKYHCRVTDIADLYTKTSSKWISSYSLSLLDGNSTEYAQLTITSIGGGSYRFGVNKYYEPTFSPSQSNSYIITIAQFDDGQVPLYRAPSPYPDVDVLDSDGNTLLGMHLSLNAFWWHTEIENLCSLELCISVGDTFDASSLDGLVINLSNTYLLFDDNGEQQLTWTFNGEDVYGTKVNPTVDGGQVDIHCGGINTQMVTTGGIYISSGYCSVDNTSISGYGNSINMHVHTLNISTPYDGTCLMELIGGGDGKGYLHIPNLLTGEEFVSPMIRNYGDTATFPGVMSVYVTTEIPVTREAGTIYIVTE